MRSPGFYRDIPAEDYHADRDTISSTGLRKLTPPLTPADLRDYLDNPQEDTDALTFGRMMHDRLAGIGPKLIAIGGDWRTKAAQTEIAETVAAGFEPVKPDVFAQITGMVTQIESHATAKTLLTNGDPEVSAYFTDPGTGVNVRVRFDVLPEKRDGRRLIVPDYKTTAKTADEHTFAKTCADYAYHQQADLYRRALIVLGIDDDPAFVFVVQSKRRPYLVNVIELDDEAMHLGRVLNDRALRIYAECLALNEWPGYGIGVKRVGLPGWYVNQMEEVA